MYSSLNIYRRK